MEYKEDDYLQLSGIQHFIFCRRQWALIHIENQWKDNLRTTEGIIMHERAHNQELVETRGDTLIIRGLPISSSSLGVSGQCDIVELHLDPDGIPVHGRSGLWKALPVEYKRGKPKDDSCDQAQLCAEAMCLEEMLGATISEGALYYGEVRRRMKVIFSEELRSQVKETFEEMHRLFERKYTPKSKAGKRCNACSLKEVCMPGLFSRQSVKEYIREVLCGNS